MSNSFPLEELPCPLPEAGATGAASRASLGTVYAEWCLGCRPAALAEPLEPLSFSSVLSGRLVREGPGESQGEVRGLQVLSWR